MFLAVFLGLISTGLSEEIEAYPAAAKQVGALKPPLCWALDVHLLVDSICVFCRRDVGLYRCYERQHPFQPLTVIHTEEIMRAWQSIYSENVNSFYVLGYPYQTNANNLSKSELKSVIWQIQLDDHKVSVFVSFPYPYHIPPPIFTVSSDGDLFLVYVDPAINKTRVVICDSSGAVKENFTTDPYSLESGYISYGLFVFGEEIFISVINFTGRMYEQWVDVWTIESLKDGKGEGHVNGTRRLNISERYNGNDEWLHVMEYRGTKFRNAYLTKISFFACSLPYWASTIDEKHVGPALSDLYEFYLCPNASKWCTRSVEMFGKDKTYRNCELSIAMKAKQNLFLFAYDWTVEIFSVP